MLDLFLYLPTSPGGWFLLALKWAVLIVGLGLIGFTAASVTRSAERLFLVQRYLRRKVIPIFALLAVTLCVFMVVLVISVMGGFLSMMRGAARTLTADVVISSGVQGFEHYEEMLADLPNLPEVAAAAPLVRTFGLIKIGSEVQTVQVEGIDARAMERVTDFREQLQWTSEDRIARLDEAMRDNPLLSEDDRSVLEMRKQFWRQVDLIELAMDFEPVPNAGDGPGMIPGIEISPYNARDGQGQYDISGSLLLGRVPLTVMRLTRAGQPVVGSPTRTQEFIVVNEFKSGLYEIDANRIYVPFAELQAMLLMERQVQAARDPDTGEPIPDAPPQVVPARTHDVLIRGAEGVPLAEVQAAVERYVSGFRERHPQNFVVVRTWEQIHSTILGAVEREKVMLSTLFGFISIVAVVMIGVIFYMIVLEKTRDIGVLRALGGSRHGVTAMFLGYGLAIGVIGSIAGVVAAAVVVANINEIHDFIGWAFNVQVWDKRIYYFDRIPAAIDPLEAAVIISVAIVASIVGALVPAFRAGTVDPVESLRYE